MKLMFRDFVPNQLTPPGLFREGDFGTLEDCLQAANQWVEESNIKLINIETVVLPNIWSQFEEGSTDVSLGTGDTVSRWHQFIRCWYQIE